MRVGTLDDQATLEYLSKHFVLVTHNQLPELYCLHNKIDATSEIPYPKQQLDRVTEGVGGGNVRSLFCTPDGRIVSYVSGLWKPKTYLEESSWALGQIRKLEQAKSEKPWWDPSRLLQDLREAHQNRQTEWSRERDDFASPAEVERLIASIAKKSENSTTAEKNRRAEMFNRLAAFNRLIRSHREAEKLIGKPVKEMLQQLEDEVYTKGSIGCDS